MKCFIRLRKNSMRKILFALEYLSPLCCLADKLALFLDKAALAQASMLPALDCDDANAASFYGAIAFKQ